MYLQVRVRKNGKEYYTFTYTGEDGRRYRVPRSRIPPLNSREEAEQWMRSQEAIGESRAAYVAAKLAWREKYYNYTELLEKFLVWKRETAPNSWESARGYMEHWVFPYFLTEKHLGNVGDWHLHYQQFLDWLRSPERVVRRGKRRPLSASQINNVVKCLNTFITFLAKYSLIDRDIARIKCESLPDHMLGRRSYKDVIQPEENTALVAALRGISPAAADYQMISWHTGMRWNELYSLPITALFRGEPTNEAIREELRKCGITAVGYIYLESQAVHDDGRREPDGSILRKPLKGRREIHPKWSRTIPIESVEVWNILATRYKLGLLDHADGRYGSNKENYRMFEDLEWNEAQKSLRKACEVVGIPRRTYHYNRHSYNTFLVGRTRSFFLARAILGHLTEKSFNRYLHIFEQLGMESRKQEQVIDLIPE
jgi:integrase